MPVSLAAVPAPATTGDKAALGKSIRDYLMANPEVLVEAMQELERKQDSQRDTVAQKAIQENRAALMSDPESPIVGNPNGDVTIVEFSDYQCPYCKRAHTTVKSVLTADEQGEARLQGSADPGRAVAHRSTCRSRSPRAGQARRACTTP